MKLVGKQIKVFKQTFLFCFLLLFSTNFLYQRIADNEINCGALGSPESGCPYAFLDHNLGNGLGHELGEDGEHSDHVCISCPCNSIVSVTWNLFLSHVLINLHKVYFIPEEVPIPEFSSPTFLFRPPKHHLT